MNLSVGRTIAGLEVWAPDSASGKSSDLPCDLESLPLAPGADNAELTWLHYLIRYFGNYKEIRACEFSL